MNVYLSARYPRQAEIRMYRDDLDAIGIPVVSRWLDESPAAQQTAQHALDDIDDIYDCDVFVAFAEYPDLHSPKAYASRGGRHVEFGIAYETGCTCIVVGGEPDLGENVFHLLPGVVRVGDWPAAMDVIAALAMAELDAQWDDRIATIWDETIDSHTKGSE